MLCSVVCIDNDLAESVPFMFLFNRSLSHIDLERMEYFFSVLRNRMKEININMYTIIDMVSVPILFRELNT